MAPKLFFAAQQYAQLLLVVAVAWGLGRAALRFVHPGVLHGPFRHGIPLAVGLGLLIAGLQGLAVAGALKPLPLSALGALGMALALAELVRLDWRASLQARRAAWRGVPLASRLLALATLILAASTMLAPLAPPRAWDELMYHLPHAAQWAATGKLTVNEWLRYPWFPYNYNLLYAAALVVGNDVLPHLLHALAGWLTALLLLAWARRRFGLDRALLATMIWLWLARGQFGNAYIDLGVALFVFLAFICLELWCEERTDGWLVLCAFAAGVAVGSKYQAVAFLPFIAIAAWSRQPAPRLVAAAAAAFLLPCAYWYARNVLLAGDPVAPLAGRWLGFTDWNLADYDMQIADLRKAASWPPRMLWPAIVAIAWQLLRINGGARLASAFALWSLLVWAGTSRYDRYLLTAYPVLALLAVLGSEQLLRATGRLWRGRSSMLQWVPASGAATLVALFCATAAHDLGLAWSGIAATPAARDTLLAGQVTGYRMWQYLRAHPHGRIYQVRLEDAIYYAPRPIWGDHFGPWRYADYVRLEPGEMRQRLAGEGFDALLVHTGRARALVSKPGFTQHFTLQRQEGELMLFSIRKADGP